MDLQTRTRFAADLLRTLHDPVSGANIHALLAWMQAEGGSARFNPFNTTLPRPGASAYNSVGVRNYPSYRAGLEATAQTLRGGAYGRILADLHRSAAPILLAQDVGRSPWGTSGTLIADVLRGGVHVGHVPPAPSGHAPAMMRGAVGPAPGPVDFASLFQLPPAPSSILGQVMPPPQQPAEPNLAGVSSAFADLPGAPSAASLDALRRGLLGL